MKVMYLLLTGYVLYAFFNPLSPHQGRAIFLLIIFVALFIRPPNKKKSRYLRGLDWVLAAVSIIVFGYIVLFHLDIGLREGMPTTTDVVMGLIAIPLAVEGTRRGMGTSLAIVVCVFLIYTLFGQYLPPEFGGHVGFSFSEIVEGLYLATEVDGIFGIAAYVFFRYIFLFFLYGTILLKTGATGFVMDFVSAIFGKRRGGAAMVAVTGSGALGSISGMAMGNVMITGVVTIPLMKKTGFKPWVAAGVEAAASSGGQIMPPVMGTASFLMMSFLAVPYSEVIKAAFIPAVLFYVAVLASVYFFSIRIGARPIKDDEIPKLKEVIKRREGITFLSSFIVLIVLIVKQFSPMLAVMYAIVVAIVVSFFTPSRLTPKKIMEVVHDTGTGFVGLGAAAAGIGLVIGCTFLTGFAFGITGLLLQWTGGLIIPTLIAVFVACFFLGMGLPPLIVYIVAVLLCAPALIELGVTPMAAHLFCFYAAICCEVSPPIAPAAYVAAMVAETNFWKVCTYSMMFSIAAHILPFSFALDSSMLLMGSLKDTIWVIGTAFAGILMLSWGTAGPFRSFAEVISRLCILGGGLLLIFPGTTNVILGAAMGITGFIIGRIESRSFRKRTVAGTLPERP